MAEKQQPIVRPRTMSLLATLSACWQRFQADLFPGLREVVGPLSERQERFVMVLDIARVEAIDAALTWRVGPSAGRARGLGSGFCRQGGLRRSDDQPIGRPSEGGQDVATSVRLGAGAGGAERGDVLACLCRIGRERAADAAA